MSKATSDATRRRASGRVARKRERARQRILDATEALLETGSIDEITIGDITNAADVGHGSFYLHFESKEAVLVPIMARRAAAFDEGMQASLTDVHDPAEVLGLSARAFGRHLLRDAMWRWFLTQSKVPVEELQRAFGRFGSRDALAGLAAGRFVVPDAEVASTFGFGGYLSVVVACLAKGTAGAAELDASIDTAVHLLLLTLGIGEDEATRIVRMDHAALREGDPAWRFMKVQ